MKVAVAGKGGVGKTFVAGALAYYYVKKGLKVLAIDADPTPNLALTLGIPLSLAKEVVPIAENAKLIDLKTGTGVSGLYRLSFSVDDIVRDFCVKSPLGVSLLVVGTVRSFGSGCACPASALVRALIHHLVLERDEVIVMDMEAGLEHVGRRTAERMDVMLAVSDPSLKSLDVAKRVQELASNAGVRNVLLIGNKVANDVEAELIKRFSEVNDIPLLGLIPYDRRVAEAEVAGETPLKYAASSSALAAVERIAEIILISFKGK